MEDGAPSRSVSLGSGLTRLVQYGTVLCLLSDIRARSHEEILTAVLVTEATEAYYNQ